VLHALKCVLLTAADGKLSARGTDLAVSLTAVEACDVAAPGSIAVEADRLIAAVKAMSAKTLTVELVDGKRIAISGDKRKASLQAADVSAFPIVPEWSGDPQLVLAPDVLASVLSRVAFSVSADRTRPHLNAALLSVSSGQTKIQTTDGHRGSIAHGPAPEGAAMEVLIPARGLDLFRGLAEDKADGTIEATRVGEVLFVRKGSITISIRLTQAVFPPLDQIVSMQMPAWAKLSAQGLLSAVRALSAVSQTSCVTLRFTADRVEVSSGSDVASAAEDEVPCSYDGSKEAAVSLSASYLADVLGAVGGAEVNIGINPEDDLSTFMLHDGSGDRWVIMPMRG